MLFSEGKNQAERIDAPTTSFAGKIAAQENMFILGSSRRTLLFLRTRTAKLETNVDWATSHHVFSHILQLIVNARVIINILLTHQYY